MIVETPRLILRELITADADGMFKLDADPEVHQYLGNSPVSKIEQSIADIAFIQNQYIKNGVGRWAVIEKATTEFLGWCGLKFITDTHNGYTNYYDVGYRFLRNSWGKGYATESAKAVIEYGFNTLNLSEIIGIADIENKRSVQVLEKAGLKKLSVFDYQGKMHHWMMIKNQ